MGKGRGSDKASSGKRRQEALAKLFGDAEDYDRASNLTMNYQFFCDKILQKEVTVDDLYAAIGKLEIISITLDQSDNAQLIFESLNSTGLALTEETRFGIIF